jgi:hypothetical protein
MPTFVRIADVAIKSEIPASLPGPSSVPTVRPCLTARYPNPCSRGLDVCRRRGSQPLRHLRRTIEAASFSGSKRNRLTAASSPFRPLWTPADRYRCNPLH